MKSFTKLFCGALMVAASLAVTPATASAQTMSSAPSTPIGVWVSPFVGASTGNDQTHSNGTAGISAGYIFYKGWLGIEGEVATAPYFFIDNTFLTRRGLTTAMANVVVVSPYLKNDIFQFQVSGGLGMIRPDLEEAGGFAKAETKKLGYNVGVGAAGFLNKNVGARVDVRYLHTLKDDVAANPFGIDFGKFGFWRTSAGLVVRF